MAVALSGCGTTVAVAVSQAVIQVTPGTVDFGGVGIGQTAVSSVAITNPSPKSIVISQVTVSGQTFSVTSPALLPAQIPAGGSLTLKIGFTPTSAGTFSGQVVITSNSATGGTTTVALTGTGTAAPSPQLAISASSLDFGSEPVNTTKSLSLTLTSTGTSAVTVNSAAISGAGFAIVGGTLPATLAPNQALTLQLQFKPATTGAATGQLVVDSNSTTSSTATVTLSGTGTAATSATAAPSPQLSLSTSTLSFGSVTVNTATTQTVTLTSTGTSPVTVNSASISGAGFAIISGTVPATLSPNQTLILQIQYKPTTTGTNSGHLVISSNSTTGATAAVALSGTATAAPSPQLSLSTSTLSFGSVTVNTATTQTVTLTSTGTSPVTVNSASISGAGFTLISGTVPTTLAPSQSVTLQLQYKPTTAGTNSGQLIISSNSTTGATAAVALSGTATASPSPQLSLSTSTLNFGSDTVNTAKTLTLTLSSTGTSPVTVNSASISGAGFTLISGTVPTTLVPSQSVTLQLQYKPTAAGTNSGQLIISSNSTTGATAAVALSGTATASPSPQLSLSTSTLSFGSDTVNTAKTLTLTLSSTGTSPVTVNSASISGAGFTLISGTVPATLSPNQTLILQIQYKPTAAGTNSGQLIISSNSTTGATAAVALSGTATAAPSPQLSLSTSTLNFGSVTVNTATNQTLTLSSTGTSPVTVNSASISGAGFTLISGTVPATLSPNQTLILQIQYKPTAAGTNSGQLVISSNSTTGATAAVALSGTATAAPSPQLSLSASTLNFGSITVNTAKILALTLTSTGTSAVTINSAAINGTGFTIVAESFPVTLTPGQSLTLQIQFNPDTAATLTGSLTISSNSTTGSTATVALTGTGTGALTPQLTLSTSALNFGSITVNTATTLTLTLTSTGTSAVTVNSAAISGAGFTLVGGTVPATLAPNQTLILQLQFKPTATGAATGQLVISSNSTTGSTATVALSGTAIAVTYTVDLTWSPPSSTPVPVTGYNVYRAISGGSLSLVNTTPDVSTSYVDSAVVSGSTYNYVVKSVDASGVESIASNEITVVIP